MNMDLSVLQFAQEHLNDVNLNDIETTKWLQEIAYLENKGRRESHDKEMANFRKEMSEFCSSIQDLQEQTVLYLQEKISARFEEAALYKAMALHLQSELSGAKESIKDRENKERILHVVK